MDRIESPPPAAGGILFGPNPRGYGPNLHRGPVVRYWPVRIETATEVLEVLVEAQYDPTETLRLLGECYAVGGLGAVVITIGDGPVDGPPVPRGVVTPLADVVQRS